MLQYIINLKAIPPIHTCTRAPRMECKENSNLTLSNTITIGDKDIGTLPYKGLQNSCPFMAPYQAPKGRIKFPMSPSP